MVPNGWNKKTLSELFEFKNGVNADKSQYGRGVKFINVMEVIKNNSLKEEDIPGALEIDESSLNLYLVKKGDVLFNRTSETPEEIGLTSVYIDDKPVVFGGFVIRARPIDNSLDSNFCKYCFHTSSTRKEIIKRGQGAIRANIGQGDLGNVSILIPPLNEQIKIAEIINVWDEAIKSLGREIDLQTKLLNSLMISLYSGDRRFKNQQSSFTHVQGIGKVPKDWPLVPFSDFSKPEIRNVKKPEGLYKGLGIRSHGKGTFLKHNSESSKIALEELFLVKENDLLVSITFAWEGAIAIAGKEDEGALTSHRFPAFEIDQTKVCLDYLRFYIRKPSFIKRLGDISPGGAGRNRVLKKSDFLKLEIPLPSLIEQEKIGAILRNQEQIIVLLEKKQAALKKQRSGLMQQLLTGKKRVKAD